VGEQLDVDRLVDALIEREGGFVDHPDDKGGPTCFGITEAVARARINERTAYDFEARLADARARTQQLRLDAQSAAADPGGRASALVPGLPAAAGGPAKAAGEDRLPEADSLTATEQAIQLDELTKWAERQHAIDPSARLKE
jgi:hypothetical protein